MHKIDRWLAIAKDDLLSAKHLFKGEFYSTAVFHCQQSAEKALKGFLAFHKCTLSKTHDLVGLLTLCTDFEQSFKNLLNSAEYLNPFATQFRYPSQYDIPSEEDVEHAIAHAQRILNFVYRKTNTLLGDKQETIFPPE